MESSTRVRITELSRDTGATVDQIRYLEKKGYIQAKWENLNTRRVRCYPESEVAIVKLIMKYFNLGYRYDVAYQKAVQDVHSPPLL